ncbi:unnamed protein product, partial [Mesorhabditis spiculigera]
MDIKAITNNLDKGSDCLVSSFTGRGLAAFIDGKVELYLDCSRNDGNISFASKTMLVPCPSIGSPITWISTSPNGSQIALIGKNDIWIVRVSPQVWATSALIGSSRFMQESYLSETIRVGPKESFPSIVGNAVKWLPTSDSSKTQYIAILARDRIRIYNVDESNDCPLFDIEYDGLLPNDRTMVKGESTYGLSVRIAAYCFLNQAGLYYLLAVDSEGNISACDFDVITGAITDPIPVKTPEAIPCEAVDFYHIEHANSALFDVVGLIGSGFSLVHLVAFVNDDGYVELYLQDQHRLSSDSPGDEPAVAADLLQNGTYLISTSSALLYVNCLPWIAHYLDAASSSGDQTSFSEILRVQPDTENKENGISTRTSSAPPLIIHTRSFDGSVSPNGLLLIHASPDLPTAFISHQLPAAPIATAPDTQFLEPNPRADKFHLEIETILSKVEPLTRPIPLQNEEDIIAQLTRLLANGTANCEKQSEAARAALAHVRGIYDSLKGAVKEHQDLTTRQNAVVAQMTDNSDKLCEAKSRILSAEDRLNRIFTTACANLPLSEDEQKILQRLQAYKKDVERMEVALAKKTLELAMEGKKRLPPTRSFVSTPQGRQANTQRCVREVECLVERMDGLKSRADALANNSF